MFERVVLIAMPVLALCLLACGPTAAQVNESGHESYLAGDYDTALGAYQDAQGRAPDSAQPYYNSGNVLYRTEEYAEALQRYDESLIYAGGELRADGFFNRGNAAFRQSQYAQAVEAYKEVLRMNPDDRDAKHNLELALLQIPPQDQQEDKQQEEEQRDEPQEEENKQNEQDEQDEQDQDKQQQEQEQPITEAQARQILESVGESAQTLQERRGQVLVSPKPTSEFDW